MKKQEFSSRVAELAEQAAQGTIMSAREVLEELTKIDRANMANFVRAFECLDPVEAVNKLRPDQTAAIAEVTSEDFTDGAGEEARNVRRIKFKLISSA
jgi:phage terminase small subunit